MEECKTICEEKGFDPYTITKNIQPICFEDAAWAYTVGAAIAIKKGVKTAAEAAEAIGIGLQAFCIPGSVAEDRKVGLGHGNLGAMLLRDETKCFAFLAGHESFAAAEGAIGIARTFAYGGSHNRAIYDPELPPRTAMNQAQYYSSKSTSLNHFYEKLFLLEGMMNTETGKAIARRRTQYMQQFVDEFLNEWDGLDK